MVNERHEHCEEVAPTPVVELHKQKVNSFSCEFTSGHIGVSIQVDPF